MFTEDLTNTQTNPEIYSGTNSSSLSNENEVESKNKRKRSAPTNDHDILAIIKNLIPKWDEAEFKIRWMPKSRLQELVDTFTALLINRKITGADGGSIGEDLRLLDKEADKNIEHVKNRLGERLGSKKEAILFYPKLGIVKGSSYKFPRKRETRLSSIDVLLTGLTILQLEDIEYGKVYWTDLKNRYEQLLSNSRNTAGLVTGKVINLNEIRLETRKFNNAFISIMKGHYPDTWQSVIREYGFLKEKY